MAVTPEYIVSGLVKRGVPRLAAVALAGNASVESGFKADVNEYEPLVEGSRGGFGLWQHTGPRRRQLEAFARSQDRPVDDPDTQMDFVAWELANTEKSAAASIYRAQTPEEAARAVSERFLRPGIPHLDRRIQATRAIADGAPMEITNVQQVDSSNAPDYSRLTEAYNNGLMNEQQRAIYEAAVADGRIQPASQPAQPAQPAPISRIAPEKMVEAYRQGAITPDQRRIIDSAIQAGRLQMPEGTQFGGGLNPQAMSQQDRDAWNAQRGGQPGLQYLVPDAADSMVPTDADAGPLPDRSFRETRAGQLDQTVNLSSPLLSTAGRAAQGAIGSQPSVVAPMLEGAGFSDPVQNTIGRVGDAGLAALTGVGGVIAGGAGLIGDAADAVGVPGADRLGREFMGMMEAFAGTMGAPLRATAPRIRAVNMPNETPAPSTVLRDAERAGINVMTSDVRAPRTYVGRTAQTISEQIPIAGTGSMRANQAEQRVNAIERTVSEFGGADSAVNDILVNVSRDFLGQRAERINRYWTQKDDVIRGLPQDIPVDVSRTVARIDDEIAQLQSLRSPEFAPLIRQLEGWRGSIQNQSLSNVEQLRKQMGESFKSGDLANISSRGEAAVRRIYGPLRDDMGSFIRANGQRQDYNRWMVANSRLSEMAGELNIASLRAALQKGEQTPETIRRMLFSGNTSDVRRLYRGLSEDGRANARAAVMAQAFEKAGGLQANLSAQRFSNEVASMGRQVGVLFTGEDKAVVNGLMRTLRLTQQADRAGLNPPTGQRLAPYGMFITGAMATDSMVAGGAATGGIGLMARAYESPPVRNALMRLSRARPNSPAEQRILLELQELNFNPGQLAPATMQQEQTNAR